MTVDTAVNDALTYPAPSSPAQRSMNRKRVLIVQPSLQPPGGGNAVAAWVLEALRDDCEVSLLSWRHVECRHQPLRRTVTEVRSLPALPVLTHTSAGGWTACRFH